MTNDEKGFYFVAIAAINARIAEQEKLLIQAKERGFSEFLLSGIERYILTLRNAKTYFFEQANNKLHDSI